jgi:hypothetical protein
MIHCTFHFTHLEPLIPAFSLPLAWNGITISDCLSSWLSDRLAPHPLVAHVCWQTWIERNHVIFEGRTPSCQAVFHRVLSSFIWQPTTVKIFQYKACEHSLMAGGTLVCFDGAALPNGLCCGAGGTFKTHSSRITKWYLNCGTGSNNKAELMGLWASLYLASCWSLNHLLVLGDSRVIIDWINQNASFILYTLRDGNNKLWSWLLSSPMFTSSIFPDIIILRRMPYPKGH